MQDLETIMLEILAESSGKSIDSCRVRLSNGLGRGIDSLQAVEVLTGIEERIGVYVPDDALGPGTRSWRSLVQTVEKYATESSEQQ